MRLLDLFCGAGGAAKGYADAGFKVVGVDINPQPNYPYEFIQGDALTYLYNNHYTFDAVHASPPCQRYSAMSACRPGLAADYLDLIAPTRAAVRSFDLPYVIENVAGSSLVDPVWLCGQMFGLELYRHRGFESNWTINVPAHPPHVIPASKAGHWRPGTIMSVAGHVAPIAKAREVMGIDWMTRDELSEAIPPLYARYVGDALMALLSERAA